MATVIIVISFIGALYFINKSNWIMVVVCGLICYGASIYHNEEKIEQCIQYLAQDEAEFNKKVYESSNGQIKLDHIMGLQYARPLCIQMNQVSYYNAGFLYK